MQLYRLTIINYKSIKCLTVDFERDLPNIFIGINDCGKSTILGALKLLLDLKCQFHFHSESKAKSDLSNTPISALDLEACFVTNNLPMPSYNGKQSFIVGQFKLDEDEINEEFQDEASPHLKWSQEKCGTIKLMRRMNQEDGTSSYFLASMDSKELKSYWSMAQRALDNEIRNQGISKDDIENDNNKGPFSNLEKVRALYNRCKLEEYWRPYEEKELKSDLKFFPKFRLLDWNFSFKDLEELAQEAMNDVIGEYEKQLRGRARELQEQAREGVNSRFKLMTETLLKDLPTIKSIKSNIAFNVESRLTDIMLNKKFSDGDIHLESQGDGIKRQIWFALLKFKSLLENPNKNKFKSHLWCFDEPETHLYPAAQRDFYEIIKGISSGDCQTIVSTHSTIFIDRTQINLINKVNLVNGYSEVKRCTTVDDIYEALELRNSDFLFFNKFLAVEGPTDNEVIPHLYKLYFNRSLIGDGIQIVDLGGETQSENNRRILEKLLHDFGKVEDRLVFILDKDSDALGENAFCVGTYDFEDGLSDELWIKFVQEQASITLDRQDLARLREMLEDKKDRKFYRLLQDLVRQKKAESDGVPFHQVWNQLPKKGKELGAALKSYFEKSEDIPEKIRNAFDYIMQDPPPKNEDAHQLGLPAAGRQRAANTR